MKLHKHTAHFSIFRLCVYFLLFYLIVSLGEIRSTESQGIE
jgi:hypothetical protein